MIVSATRIRTSRGARAIGAHVFTGAKNERIDLVHGDRADLDDMVADAEGRGCRYAIRHYSISPEQATTREQAMEIIHDLGREFGFDVARAVVVEHQKRRAGAGGFDQHWHVMAPEFDPVSGRVMSDKWMRPRHEKIARCAEMRLGHQIVIGRWNAAVERRLRADGRDAEADRITSLVGRDRPCSAFTANAHQMTQRAGRSLPNDRALIKDAWQRADSGRAFVAALADAGLTIRHGDKKAVYVIERDGSLVGAADRLVGKKRADVASRLVSVDLAGQTKEGQHSERREAPDSAILIHTSEAGSATAIVEQGNPGPPPRDNGATADAGQDRANPAIPHPMDGRAARLACQVAKPLNALAPLRDKALQAVVRVEHKLRNDSGPNPKTAAPRFVFAAADAAADAVHAAQRQREDALRTAQARVGPIGRVLAVIGIPTPAVRAADQLYDAWKAGMETLDEDVWTARRTAIAEAEIKQAEQETWRAGHQHDVYRVRMVRQAIERGREDIIEDVAKGRFGIAANRLAAERRAEIVLRQQAEDRRRQAAEDAKRLRQAEIARHLAWQPKPQPDQPTYRPSRP